MNGRLFSVCGFLLPGRVQSYILLLCWLNQCYYFCQVCSDSPVCPDGLLANLWFHSLLLLMCKPEKTFLDFRVKTITRSDCWGWEGKRMKIELPSWGNHWETEQKSRTQNTKVVSHEGIKDPTAPGSLGLEKACQGHPGKAPKLLFLCLSDLENPQNSVWVRVRFKKQTLLFNFFFFFLI